jgi:hypothetical protein
MTGRAAVVGGVLLDPVRRWECGSCNRTLASRKPGIPLHRCRNGLDMPFVPEGELRKVTVNPREDYVNGDLVTTDAEGRVPMSVTVERPDGVDTAVYAPCAVGSRNDL